MPRQSRIDYPGALHHVIVRGLERKSLFRDGCDHQAFLDRLERTLVRTLTPCYAFALIPNHFHLLLVTGKTPISRVMASLLTAYAACFNRRHLRSGKLYQNRYKSIRCDEEGCFLELIRYIHLNPLRAGLVKSMAGLASFRWAGHGAMMGRFAYPWLATDEVLLQFGGRAGPARREYEAFVAEGIAEGRREDLTGGGLVRSEGGDWAAVKAIRGDGKKLIGDERILGPSRFVEEVLGRAGETEDHQARARRDGWTPERILREAARIAKVSVGEMRGGSKRPAHSQARALACLWMMDGLGMTGVEVARTLDITSAAVFNARKRGPDVARRLRVSRMLE